MKEELYSFLKSAVVEGLSIIEGIYNSEMEAGRTWIFRYHYDYPTMTMYDSGFPNFSKSGSEKINFGFLLNNDQIRENRKFNEYADFVLANSKICEHYRIGDAAPDYRKQGSKMDLSWNDSYTYFHICHFCDSYIHRYSFQFSEENFQEMFDEYYQSFSEEVVIDVYIPILLVNFESEKIELTDRVVIEKMSPAVQLSRNEKTSYTNSAHASVVGAANYAIVLKNWTIKSIHHDGRWKSLTETESYRSALDIADQVISALRITIPEIDTGYVQVFAIPVNWKSRFDADLLESYVASEKNYPSHFENFGWLNKAAEIETLNDRSIIKCFNALLDAPRLELAASRLKKACLERRSDDAIIDVAIALESILTSDSKSEITFRLATRAALLVKAAPFDSYSSDQVFNLCKKIYDFRSSIVHGDKKKQLLRRKIEIIEGEFIETNEVAIRLLCHILQVMIDNPDLSTTNGIDKLLFT